MEALARWPLIHKKANMQKTHSVGAEKLTLATLGHLLRESPGLVLSAEAVSRIQACRDYLDQALTVPDKTYYGINTGFGALYDIVISPEQIVDLQHNLIRSHACGTGAPVPPFLVRLMLFLKTHNIALGYSGVREAVASRLLYFFNEDILPVVLQQGSLGASGDLAPLAHLALPLIGEGEVWHQGIRKPAAEVLRAAGMSPLQLAAKEGLALLNGTQFSSAYAAWCTLEAQRLFALANLCAALSIDAFDCRMEPFDPLVHQIRPHPGQVLVAEAIRHTLQGSEMLAKQKTNLQDPYAFRCVPQVHGASWAAIAHTAEVVETEINSVTDNPNIFPEAQAILSGGNFHAQPLALVLDYLGIALAELGSISERRTYQLISGKRELPMFLTPKPGLHSGLMIPQYTAASIASQNKQLATPASVDSIVSSNMQEDHVSMSANAGTKTFQIVENLERLLAIEFMTAAQAMAFRRPLRTSPLLEALLEQYRAIVPVLQEDRVLSTDIHQTIAFMRTIEVREFVQ